MRPYLLLTVVVLAAVAAFGQQPFVHSGPCLYGCGPFIPLATTPEISLQQVSPNPVGASNATTGLVAGATNSTLSEVSGSTSSVYTDTVWVSGGGYPLTAPQVHEGPGPFKAEAPRMREEHMREEHAPRVVAGGAAAFYAGEESASSVVEAAGTKGQIKAGHAYTNDDVTRQNDKNGTVKYKGKTEKI